MPTISKSEAKKRKYEPNNIQTILFDKDKWTKATSTKWLKEHNYITDYYRTTTNQIRRMQRNFDFVKFDIVENPIEGATY